MTSTSPVFLGGACGRTTWRQDIAIPILDAAGIPYYNPQLDEGAWTPAHQYAEMVAKEQADVWLFVIAADTRSIASIGEVAYRIGQSQKIALAMSFLQPNLELEGRLLHPAEIDDLNRGRIFVQAMAERHGVPVFEDIAAAARHAVALAQQAHQEQSIQRLERLIQQTEIHGYHFEVGRLAGHFTIRIRQAVINNQSGDPEIMNGRLWLIEPDASDAAVVRTLLKAVLTWEEHEIRERFRFDGKNIFHPHFDLPE